MSLTSCNKDVPTSGALADDLLFGAQAIADELGVSVRKTFYLLERSLIPARKIGATWTSTRSRLRQHFEETGSAVVAPTPRPTPRPSRRRHRAASR
jgi:hypothetical protein